MAEVMLPPSTPTTTSIRPTTPPPPSQSPSTSTPQPQSQPAPRARTPSPSAHRRTSHHSLSSPKSTRALSPSLEYPVFPSTLTYALVRDFAYPISDPLHYGAILEPSRSSSPDSAWNQPRRGSAPSDSWTSTSYGEGWSSGPWYSDNGRAMYGTNEDEIAALPSTSFGSEPGLNDELSYYNAKHKKSKSYTNMADFERGRRRESGRRRSRGDDGGGGLHWYEGQHYHHHHHADNRRSRAYDANGTSLRKDSPFSTSTNPHTTTTAQRTSIGPPFPSADSDDPLPLDTEPYYHPTPTTATSEEDDELFAGPSLALYAFEPENPNELRLDEGQEIMVSYRHGQGWLVASDPLTGEQGLVPEAYVRLIADMPNYDPEKGEFVDLEEFEEEEGVHPIDALEELHGDERLLPAEGGEGVSGVEEMHSAGPTVDAAELR